MPRRPLVDDVTGAALRAWRRDDAPALAAAWADPEIARDATVPVHASLAAAERWIGGAPLRAEAGVSLDLVIGPAGGDEVWGEVGMARLRLTTPGGEQERTAWDLGWWVVGSHRGRGVATAAVGLLVRWAMAETGPTPLVARIRRGNLASEAVASQCGFTRRGAWNLDHALWMLGKGDV